ncbi:hypothetical protein TRSC58_07624 [Trypanosoma rangeli SC58]|uniref:Uncharacterized protein n=1 Tax=Trypanosoma rangeli SC58 TaxID=429131 RepID=A0A061IRJ2_TRYRA|nr:hypothetical protein TRSC58_07624 [Trypanosoma rangeli SC58]
MHVCLEFPFFFFVNHFFFLFTRKQFHFFCGRYILRGVRVACCATEQGSPPSPSPPLPTTHTRGEKPRITPLFFFSKKKGKS